MSYREPLAARTIAISISESPDMEALGLSKQHLRDAMVEIARHLLALGARLVYGGDLRGHGFSELLFELVARHRRDVDKRDRRASVTSYLAWPVHIQRSAAELASIANDLHGTAKLVFLRVDGSRMLSSERRSLQPSEPTKANWSNGLTAMRKIMLTKSDARIVLGGRVAHYMGTMPGIAEEALLSLEARQPLYVLGGFGGCARDIAETLQLVDPWVSKRSSWRRRSAFKEFSADALNNGLTREDNATLARTPHVDEAVMLILRGLLKKRAPDRSPK